MKEGEYCAFCVRKQQTRAGVTQAIKLELRKLLSAYTRDLRSQKLATTFAHLYDAYSGAGRSVYQPSATPY